jgi:hypothetical protein
VKLSVQGNEVKQYVTGASEKNIVAAGTEPFTSK